MYGIIASMSNSKPLKVLWRVPTKTKQYVDRYAALRGISVNAAAVELLESGLKFQNPDMVSVNTHEARASLVALGKRMAGEHGGIGAMYQEIKQHCGDSDTAYMRVAAINLIGLAKPMLEGKVVTDAVVLALIRIFMQHLEQLTPDVENSVKEAVLHSMSTQPLPVADSVRAMLAPGEARA